MTPLADRVPVKNGRAGKKQKYEGNARHQVIFCLFGRKKERKITGPFGTKKGC